MDELFDQQMVKTTYAKALTQNDIDEMSVRESEASELRPGWYWISSWPAYEKGRVLVIFTPFAQPENDLAVFFNLQEAL